MARHLQLLSLLSRMSALSVTPMVSTRSRGCFGRGAGSGGKAWTVHSQLPGASNRVLKYNEECDGIATEEVEDKLHELMSKEMKRKNTIKYNIQRRKMTHSGAPDRRLTWEAIEQIRYLKQEQPEDWTVERLAEGFSVSPDVILRVLRSKFTPATDRKAKQDAKVVTALGQQMLPTGGEQGQGCLMLPGNQSVAAVTPGSRESALVPVSGGTQMAGRKKSVSLMQHSAPAGLQPIQFNASTQKHATMSPNPAEGIIANTYYAENSKDNDEGWDGQVFSEEELEDLIEMKAPSPPVQVGNDFFDSEGNFLYRI